MSAIDERNKRLDNLLTVTKQWGEKRVKELEDKVTVIKALLKGRTGAERINNSAVTATQEVVVNSIEEFLDG